MCVRTQQQKAWRWEGRAETGKALMHKTNKAQAAVIKTSLVLVMRRNAAEIAAISDRPRPKLVWDPCSVQLRAFNQQPSVFPPHLARTGFWINSAEQGGE